MFPSQRELDIEKLKTNIKTYGYTNSDIIKYLINNFKDEYSFKKYSNKDFLEIAKQSLNEYTQIMNLNNTYIETLKAIPHYVGTVDTSDTSDKVVQTTPVADKNRSRFIEQAKADFTPLDI